MINLSNLSPKIGSNTRKKRKGRGIGGGLGKTAGKGHKGQKARKSADVGFGFEGGQTPLYKRVPKFGFSRKHKSTVFNLVALEKLEKFADNDVIDQKKLEAAGLIKKNDHPVKVLASESFQKKLTVKVNKISAKAQQMIEKNGGKVEIIKL